MLLKLFSMLLLCYHRPGADPEGGHRGHVPPPLERMGSHNLPRTDKFFKGVVGGGGGGYMVSGKGQNKDIEAIYYQNKKTLLHKFM